MSHLDLPLRLASGGALATVAADSAKDVANSVGVLIATRPGERLCVPAYGTPDPLFRGLGAGVLQAAVTTWEPRADPTEVAVTTNPDGSIAVTMNAGS